MKVRCNRSHARDRDWIIAHHARLNGFHEELVGQGFAFAPGKLRFWRCKDGSFSIRLVYEKKQPSYRQEQAVLLRLRPKGHSGGDTGGVVLETRGLQMSVEGRL